MKDNRKHQTSDTTPCQESSEQVLEPTQDIWQKFDLGNIKFIFNDDLSHREIRAVLAAVVHVLEE